MSEKESKLQDQLVRSVLGVIGSLVAAALIGAYGWMWSISSTVQANTAAVESARAERASIMRQIPDYAEMNTKLALIEQKVEYTNAKLDELKKLAETQ